MQDSPIVLTTLAGLSTGLGGLLAVLCPPSERLLAASAGFAGGVMLTASLADLMPEALAFYGGYLPPLACGGAVVSLLTLGMLTAGLLGRLLPEEAALAARFGKSGDPARAAAMRTALVTGLALLLHNFPEGVLTFFAGTAGTGGFSNKALSVGAYNSPYFEIVIGVFMLLFGINFNLYYFLLLRHFREALASEEMHVYLGIVAFSTLTITANIASMYDSVGTALRTAFFQVSSIVTTTGYATADFNLWPTYSRIVIVILTFVGACAGSTAGGLKVSRVIILFKAARQDLNKMLHSHAVTTVRFEGKPLDEKTLRGVHNYFNIYMLLLTLSVLLLSLDGFDLVTTFTSVATCLNNVGPGLEMVGPMGSFADFSAPAKLLLAFDMLAGRLELYPMLALFAPRLWRKRINAMHEARAK